MSTTHHDGAAGFDALRLLRNAGHPVDLLSEAQRAVFAALSPAEVNTLNSLKERLDEAEPEVLGHDVKIL